MSAIAGIIYPELSPLSYAVGPALEALRFRAPGAVSTYLYKNLEIGTRGSPIGHNVRRTLSLAFDGQITNQEEITTQLKKAGFKTDGISLADLLVHAYDEWGEELPLHLKGAFALAVFDQEANKLVLIRDRLGIRPLYWAYQNDTLLFASELKALLATGLIPQVVDEDAISAYLFLGYVPQDLSPVKGVNKLLPGCKLTLAGPGNLRIQPYWSYADLLAEDQPIAGEELVQTLERDIKRGIPTGNLGYPSQGTLPAAALASQLGKGCALAVEYQGQNEEEIERVLSQSQDLHHQLQTTSMVPANLLEPFPEMVWHLDEPIADPSLVGFWNLLQGGAKQTESLCLDVGAAELFALHSRYYDPHLTNLLSKPPAAHGWGSLKRALLYLLHWTNPGTLFHRLRKGNTYPWLSYFFGAEALFPPTMLQQLSPQIPRFFDPDVFSMRLYHLSELGDTPSAFLFLDEKTRLPGRLLPYDRLCAVTQTSWSAPFLNQSIVELIARIPDTQKLASDPTQHPIYQLLSPPLRDKPFSPFPSSTFLNPYLNDTTIRQAFGCLANGTLVETGWLDRRWIKRVLERPLQQQATFTQLWGLLHLEVWMHLFINTPIVDKPPEKPLFQILQRG